MTGRSNGARVEPGPADPNRVPDRSGRAPVYDLIELFFFAYRDFVSDPDRILGDYGFGRAHHRVLHFVDRQPGLTIAELLDILQITKQSLNRVLKELIEKDFIESRTGTADRRQRLLHTTPKGHDLAAQARASCRRGASCGPCRDRRGTAQGEVSALPPRDDRRRTTATMWRSSCSERRPIRRTVTRRADGATRVDIPDHAPHVLVVDDDRRLRDLLARFLSEHGYRVTTAASAAEARAKAESFVFDALVLDVMMPGESGLRLCAQPSARRSQVPILMLTARADTADRVTGLEIGADDYLPKPFEPRELILRLGNILQRSAPAADARDRRRPGERSASARSSSASTAASCGATRRSCASPSASARS